MGTCVRIAGHVANPHGRADLWLRTLQWELQGGIAMTGHAVALGARRGGIALSLASSAVAFVHDRPGGAGVGPRATNYPAGWLLR
jgi:hypothetical protein